MSILTNISFKRIYFTEKGDILYRRKYNFETILSYPPNVERKCH